MTTKQYREMERQATVTQTRVQRFIELQTQVNNLIESLDEPNDELRRMADELDQLGDQLNDNEIHQVVEWYNENNKEADMYYEDVEWMVN